MESYNIILLLYYLSHLYIWLCTYSMLQSEISTVEFFSFYRIINDFCNNLLHYYIRKGMSRGIWKWSMHWVFVLFFCRYRWGISRFVISRVCKVCITSFRRESLYSRKGMCVSLVWEILKTKDYMLFRQFSLPLFHY